MAMTIRRVEVSDFEGTHTGIVYTDIPEPSSFRWSKQDISGQEAGRTMTTDAWKNMKAKARTLELTWINRFYGATAQALQAFDHEYVWIQYRDALTGQIEEKHFYMGDMTADMYNDKVHGGVWSNVRVKCIQAITDKV